MNHEQTRTDTNGNAAAMRESLITCRNIAAWIRSGNASVEAGVERIQTEIDKALSAPARNCDRDLSDRQSIWEEFCQWVRSSSLGCASDPSAGDAFEWLLSPAAEQEGGEA
jgi:hypothetical protein